MRPSERSFTSPAAIWLRPALCTQTNSTSGWSLPSDPLGLGERLQPLAREAVREHGHEDVDLRARRADRVDSADVAGDRLLGEDAGELVLEPLGGLVDVVLR